MIGQHLGHFEILEKLGEGGMGAVYRALDTTLHRHVALKVLSATARDPAARQRLMEEARAASALNHPAIVTLYEVGSFGDHDFIAMEAIKGETIAEALHRGPLGEEEVLELARTLNGALAEAHRCGIVHRDLKPSNVMLTGHGPKILDFGLAKRTPVRNAPSDNDLPTVDYVVQSTDGAVSGTPSYMAPEQARGERTDERSDLFSLGCLIFEMLTGERCFPGESLVEVLSAVLRVDPPPPSRRRPELDPAWDVVLGRLLAKKPSDRYQTAAEVDRALAEIETGSRPRRPSGRSAMWVVVVIGLLLGLAVWWWGGREPESATALDQDFPHYRFRLLLDRPGSEREPSLAPDGQRVAFVSEDEDGVSQVWLTDLQGSAPERLTHFEFGGVRDPVWTAAGDTLIVAQGRGLWEVDVAGSEPRLLVDEGIAPAVSSDDRYLAFNKGRQVWIANRDGGDPRALAGFEARHFGDFAKPVFSPDGEKLLFFWPMEDRPLGDLWIVAIDGSEARRLTDLGFLSWGTRPAWSADGRWVVFTADHSGSTTLWRIAAEGGEAHPITEGAGSDFSPSLSANLETLVYSNGRNFAEISVYDPATGREHAAHRRRDLAVGPEVSPDGRRVAFFARSPSAFHLFLTDIETGEVSEVSQEPGSFDTQPTWSQDGAALFYYQQEPTESLRRLDLESGEDELILDDWRWSERMNTNVSPDGRRAVYELRDRGRTLETRVRDLETGREKRLSGVLHGPRWYPDGQAIYGAIWDPYQVHRCVVDGGCTPLTDGWDAQLSSDGQSMYLLRGSPPVIWRRDLATGREERVHAVHEYDPVDFGWGPLVGGTVMHHSQQRADLELWIGSAREPEVE